MHWFFLAGRSWGWAGCVEGSFSTHDDMRSGCHSAIDSFVCGRCSCTAPHVGWLTDNVSRLSGLARWPHKDDRAGPHHLVSRCHHDDVRWWAFCTVRTNSDTTKRCEYSEKSRQVLSGIIK